MSGNAFIGGYPMTEVSMEAASEGAILPLSGGSHSEVDAWRSVALGESLLVTWRPSPEGEPPAWGPVLQAGSSLAQQLASVAARSGTALAGASSTLFRVEVPAGFTLQSLVPAVGGGFRGLVRTTEATKIAGSARLVPVGGASVGAGLALGPLVGLLALSVGAEMLARHQQDKKLSAIHDGVQALRAQADETVEAQLRSVSQALELGSAALLDKVEIPSSVGIGAARNNLRDIRNRAESWLNTWESSLERFAGHPRLHFDELRQILSRDGKSGDYRRFPMEVAIAYQAIALDSRALVLHAAEVATARDDDTLGHFHRRVSESLADNARVQERLCALTTKLASYPVTSDWWRQRASTDRAVEELDRALRGLAAAMIALPPAPGLLNSANRQVLEMTARPDGKLTLNAPELVA